jgi:hypothetical protein
MHMPPFIEDELSILFAGVSGWMPQVQKQHVLCVWRKLVSQS